MTQKDYSRPVGEWISDRRSDAAFEKIEFRKQPYVLTHQKVHEADSAIDFDYHWHPALEVLLPTTGSFFVHTRGCTTLIGRNEACIINCGTIHKTELYEHDGLYENYVLIIDDAYLRKLDASFSTMVFSHHICGKPAATLRKIMELMEDMPSVSPLAAQGFVSLILDVLKQQKTEDTPPVNSETFDVVTNVMKYLDAHYLDDIGFEELASSFGFSYGYLARVFKECTGMSMKRYLTSHRLSTAYYDLSHTDLSVAAAALKNGFPNEKAFVKVFKDTYGKTPSVFRKEVRN